MPRWLATLALIAIVVGAAAARLVDIDSNPGGLWPDEAAEAVAARQIVRDPGFRPIFLPDNGGREALFNYSVAAGYVLAGDSVTTLRAVSALWGVLGVLGIWLLARRFGTGAGLAAGAWAAGSLWLIAVSRDGMRNTITPFFGAIALLALIAWHDRPTTRRAVIAGAVLAVSTLHTYQPLKLLPIVVVLWLLAVRGADPPRFRELRRGFAAFAVSFAAVAAPMVVYAFLDPQGYLGRTLGVTPFNPNLPPPDFVTHILRTLGQFAFVGDPNERHNVAGLPMLGWALSVVALVGLAALWRTRRAGPSSLVLLSLPLMLVPQLIAPEGGSPHFLRALGLAAPLGVVVGVGAQAVAAAVAARIRALVARRWASAVDARASLVAGAAVAVLFLVVGAGSITTYLARPVEDRYHPFTFDLVEMARLANPPNDALILDDFAAYSARYLIDDARIRIVEPGEGLAGGGSGRDPIRRVLARSQADLASVLGEAAASEAEPLAWDPGGQPVVWAFRFSDVALSGPAD